MNHSNSEDSDDWDDSEEQELNDVEYSNLEERISLLEKLEDLTIEHIKISNLFHMKLKETSDMLWIEKYEELSKKFKATSKTYHEKYMDLGGPDLSKRKK